MRSLSRIYSEIENQIQVDVYLIPDARPERQLLQYVDLQNIYETRNQGKLDK